MTSYRHVTEIREHMFEIRKCCNVWPMFVRLKLALKMLQEQACLYKTCVKQSTQETTSAWEFLSLNPQRIWGVCTRWLQ